MTLSLLAAEANANSVLIQQNLGFLYGRLGTWDATRTAFRNLCALDPDHPSLTLLGEVEARSQLLDTGESGGDRRS